MVERHLAKVNVASSNLVFRSILNPLKRVGIFLPYLRRIFMNIPNDPAILVSFMNTKLRDYYSSLDALCDDLEIKKDDIISKCSLIGYEYDPDRNQFI